MTGPLSCCRQYEENGGDLATLRGESELAFAPHSRSTYSLTDNVVLELHTKNIGTEVGACCQVLQSKTTQTASVITRGRVQHCGMIQMLMLSH